MAAEICSFLWKSSCPFNPCVASLSISVGLDCNWYPVVQQCKELCMFYSCLIFPVLLLTSLWYIMQIIYLQLPEDGQKWGFLIWLLFSYCGLLCIACMSLGKVVVFYCYSSHFMFWWFVFVQNLFVLLVLLLLFWTTHEQEISENYYSPSLFRIQVSHCSHCGLLNSFCSGWHEDKHIYCVLNRVSLYRNMGYVLPLLSICYYVSYVCWGYCCLAPNNECFYTIWIT